jgi:hypothetical protein
MIIGLIADSILIREEHGTKLAWTLSPFKPYLEKEIAIVIAIIQTALTIFVPILVLTNYLQYLFSLAGHLIFPVSIMFWNTLYLTTIRAPLTEEYNFSWKEGLIAFLIYLTSFLWILIATRYIPI